ncbi:hypothetical protein WR25_16473 [Diploscapter pachys]|uniref:Uncharacterized protein n=1 Tax=Diploscapter pachys TaxID=2018661 RepID=A0A2A2KD00_9BILA|nr:hypothetical protein WR25_16473 [Diploscapter pachys]
MTASTAAAASSTRKQRKQARGSMRSVIAQNPYGAATNRAAEEDATLWKTRLGLRIVSVRLKNADRPPTAVPIARPRMN